MTRKAISRSDVRELVAELETHGYAVHLAKSGHLRVLTADGRSIFTLPNTPSDHRSLRNARACLRRMGVLPRP